MSIHASINKRFVRTKVPAPRQRTIGLKKPDYFVRILLVSNKRDEAFLDEAKTGFINAEINALYLRKKKEDDSSRFNYSVHPSDFNLTGDLKNDKLTKLINTEFDMIIDLSENSVYLNYIIAQLKSTLNIGKIDAVENQFHDLFFNHENRNSEFIKTIIRQLNILTSNEK